MQGGKKQIRLADIPEGFKGHIPESRVTVEKIVQLAHVAGPVVMFHRQTHLERQGAADAFALHVGLDKQRDVPVPLAQGRQCDGKHMYAGIKIRAHLFFQNHF